MRIYAPWEKAFNKIATPFEHFIHAQTTTGLILMITTVLALILANTPISEGYIHFFHTKLTLMFGSFTLEHSLHHWINDGLMAMFFFLVGLEIKREILVGELSNIKVAILPILSAIGGMMVPALFYLSINSGTEAANGWGIPMATDIAFAISALVLLGKRVSTALVTFLVALAIVDDLGAVAVIAIFYTEQIHIEFLALAFSVFLLLVVYNRVGIHHSLVYFLTGGVMWYFMLESGVHATIAGVIAAMAIPTKPKLTPESFTDYTSGLLKRYDTFPERENFLLHEEQKAILQNIKDKVDAVNAPAARLEHALHLPVSLVVIPLFALANAGISIDFSTLGTTFLEPVSFGIALGLIAGKVLGIGGVAWLAIKLGIAKLPEESTMHQVFGVAFLGGIGFTMSIFVAELAFKGNDVFIFQAKVGILLASLLAGTIGYLWLRLSASNTVA